MSRLWGGIMMAAGLLIAGASGLCSLAVVVMALGSGSDIASLLSGIPIVVLFGGVPFAIGLALFFGGRKLTRDDPPAP